MEYNKKTIMGDEEFKEFFTRIMQGNEENLKVYVRPLKEADIPQIEEVSFGSVYPQFEDGVKEFLESGRAYGIFMEDSKEIFYGYCTIGEADFDNLHGYVLSNMYVMEIGRSLGLGKALVDQAIAFVENFEGVAPVYLDLESDNVAGFYSKLGFAKAPDGIDFDMVRNPESFSSPFIEQYQRRSTLCKSNRRCSER